MLVKAPLSLALALCALVTSCSRAPQSGGAWQSTSCQTVESFFFDNGIGPEAYVVPDSNYALPSVEWISGEFSEALKAEQFARGLQSYENPANNCNKFSRTAAQFAGQLFYHNSTRPAGTALAFGEFLFIRDDGRQHAINFALVRDGEKLRFVFYDPQPRQIVTLSATEVRRGLIKL